MIDFATQLTNLLGPEFSKEGLDPNLAEVRRSARPDLGDFQCNGALADAVKRDAHSWAVDARLLESLPCQALLGVCQTERGKPSCSGRSFAGVPARPGSAARDQRGRTGLHQSGFKR